MIRADADSPRLAGAPRLPSPSGDARGEALPRPSAAGAQSDHANPHGCPFLVASAGGWRLDMPSRDHRCAAFSPAAPLAPEKQSRLCLTSTHTGCATYTASMNARAERLGAAPVRRATRWGLARTTSIIEDPGGIRARLLAALLDRRRWPAIPAVILVTTLFVLALSGFRAGVPTSPVATASHGLPVQTSTVGGATSRATAAPTPLDNESPPTSPSTAEPGTPRPAASFRSYTVRSGDTLSGIANRFDVSVQQLVNANDMDDPESLQIGQVLLIP